MFLAKAIDTKSGGGKKAHDDLVKLAESLLKLRRIGAATRTPHERTQHERQGEAAERAVDALVYQLYSLSAEETGIVEKETRRGSA